MASIIRIKRSAVNGNPSTLGAGELAYSALSGTISNGGDRLYIGFGTETAGNAANRFVIGGKYFTDMMDHATGTLTASSAVLVDANSKIDVWNVDNLTLDGNTISSTNSNGNILIDPNGTGYVQLVGTNGVVIPVGTTAQRGPSVQGTVRYNTDTSSFEGYSGTVWGSLGGVKSVDGLTYILAESSPGASDDTLHFWAATGASTNTEVGSWDATALSVNNNLIVGGTLSVTGGMTFTGGATFNSNLTLVGSDTSATEYFRIQNGSAVTKFQVDSANGNTTISGTLGVTGATTLSSTLGVTGNTTVGGTLGVTGEATLASATVSDLTSGRVVLAGTGGALQDSANLTFNGSALVVTGTSSVSGNSSVGGNLSVTGTGAVGGDFAVNTNKFTVASSSGNTTVAGTLGVSGATTLSSTLGVTGAATLSSTLGVTGAVTLSSTLGVTGNTTVGGTLNVTGVATFGSNVDMNAKKITNLAEPTADSDAATKYYVDAARSGLDVKGSVKAATTANITLSGTQTIDGVALSVGDRVLVKDQSTGSQNGIYVVASGGWTRATDADNNPGGEVTSGMFCFVEQGTINADCGFVLTTNDPITLGTTALDFTLFSASGTLIAGSGLSKNGYTLEVNVAASGGIEIVSDALQLKSGVAGAGLTYSSGVLNVVGTANRITVNADSIDIASTYVGQSSITTLGTIGTGVWQGSVIADAYIADDLTISGGTINNTPIGGTTRSSGAFTTLNANSTLGVTGATTLGSTLAVTGATTLSSTLGVTGNITASANITGAGAATSTLDGFNIDGGTY
jgi:hypothetical protein